MDINKLKKLNANEKITVLIKNPGIYEEYKDYYIGENSDKHKRLEKQKEEVDLLPTFTIKDFLAYYEGRQLLLQIKRDNKILSFKR